MYAFPNITYGYPESCFSKTETFSDSIMEFFPREKLSTLQFDLPAAARTEGPPFSLKDSLPWTSPLQDCLCLWMLCQRQIPLPEPRDHSDFLRWGLSVTLVPPPFAPAHSPLISLVTLCMFMTTRTIIMPVTSKFVSLATSPS